MKDKNLKIDCLYIGKELNGINAECSLFPIFMSDTCDLDFCIKNSIPVVFSFYNTPFYTHCLFKDVKYNTDNCIIDFELIFVGNVFCWSYFDINFKYLDKLNTLHSATLECCNVFGDDLKIYYNSLGVERYACFFEEEFINGVPCCTLQFKKNNNVFNLFDTELNLVNRYTLIDCQIKHKRGVI